MSPVKIHIKLHIEKFYIVNINKCILYNPKVVCNVKTKRNEENMKWSKQTAQKS